MDRINNLPSSLTKKEAAAIERRRRAEEERKERIFNPKNRILGVDCEALDAQVRERRAREEQERCKELHLDLQTLRHTQIAANIEDKMLQARRRVNQDIDSYRSAYQKVETRREFDLYDPSSLKKTLPCRVADDDPRCGPSSAQKFAGEDLQGKARVAMQRAQQHASLQQQLAEREAAQHERKRAERALQEAMLAQDRHAQGLQHVQEECRRQVQQATRDFNFALAAEQEAQRLARLALENEDKQMEVYNLMSGDLLTENPAAAISSLAAHRLIPDRWKGMTSEQRDAIRREQQRQAQLNKEEREAEARRQQDWDKYMLHCDSQALRAEQHNQHQRRQVLEHVAGYNAHLSQQQHAHRRHMEREVYANKVTDAYFNQFNTSTR